MSNKPKKDLPNFAAWNTQTLADFATEAYIKLQHQDETIHLLQQDVKMLLSRLRAHQIQEAGDADR